MWVQQESGWKVLWLALCEMALLLSFLWGPALEFIIYIVIFLLLAKDWLDEWVVGL